MLKRFTIVASAAMALAVATYAQPASDASNRAAASVQRPASGDPEFIQQAGQIAEAEIGLASLAQKQATSPQVKSLADLIKRDHEAARTELQKLAKTKNAELTAMTVAQLATYNRLEKLTGNDFDRAWIDAIIELHRDTRGLFSRAARSADADVKGFASRQATTLEDHLKRAKGLTGAS